MDCTLLLSTYDGGEDLWEGFFKALSVQWPEMDLPIVMNTETKQYSYQNYNIISSNITGNKNIPWGERLRRTLAKIHTEYTLLFLEDFWLRERVDDAFFRQTIEWMNQNPDVANFSFYPCMPGTNIDDGKFERFERRPRKCEYKLNCQVGIWRTKELLGFIRSHESAWDWEMYGSVRAERYQQKFYSLKSDAPLVFNYGDNTKGCIVRKGKWVEDAVLPMAKLYNLNIDYSIRGFSDVAAEKKELQRRACMSVLEKLREPGGIKRAINHIKLVLDDKKVRYLSLR